MRAKRERENPKIRKNKVYFRIFGTAIPIIFLAVFINGCAKETLKDQTVTDPVLNASIAETFPANQADTVVINPVIAVTFKSTASASDISASTLVLKEGTIPVSGTVTTEGTTINFVPSADLKPETDYTATIKSSKPSSHDSGEHSWSFRTGKHRQNNSLAVVSVLPLNSAIDVAVDTKPSITFNQEMTSATTKLVTISLWQGTTQMAGALSYSGKTATFTPANVLAANMVYTGKIVFATKSSGEDEDDGEDDHKSANIYTWSFTTAQAAPVDVTPPTVISVVPTNNATNVATSIHPAVTFSEAMNSTTINTTSFTLKQGSTTVAGSVAYSGTMATFTPSSALAANTVYTGTITTGVKDVAGNMLASNFTWTFTTAAATTGDVIPPTVLSVTPANNTTNVATSVHPAVTFSEAMNSTTINTTSFTLKQGSTTVAGSVAYSGTMATFTPSSALAANTVYTGTITTGVKDVAGNMLASNFTWTFTTAAATTGDVIPPTVLSVTPANNTTNVATSVHPAVTFSEAMNSTTINTTSFTLKQGSTTVAGSVAYSGTTATFTPSGALVANTVYTGTISTVAKDIAGNAIASMYTWSFTTAMAAPVDVTPPTVVSMVPASNATSVAVNSNVTATFSEAMNASNINATTFTLKQGANAVAGSVSYSGNTATFNPTSDLAGGVVYTASITTGAMDLAGNAIATTRTWSFTTVTVAPVISFATQVLPILQNRCMPCHGAVNPTAGISITNYTTVSRLSNSQLDNSSMYPKLGTTAAEITIIKAWIAAGRLNN